MSSLRLSASQSLSMLGMPGCLGVALLIAAAWFYWGEAPLVQQNLADEQDTVAHLREQLTRASASATEAPTQAVSTEAAWQQLWQNLPVAQDGEQMQARLLASTKQHGVQLGSVQFQGGVLTGLPAVWRQRMTLPVEAPYPVLRQWINEVLQTSEGGANGGENVSLDAIEISRTDVMSNTVKARLVWSLWWRAAP